MAEDIVRVLRLVEYMGPRSWVEEQVKRSILGTKVIELKQGGTATIRAFTLGEFPEVVSRESGQEYRDMLCLTCSAKLADVTARGGPWTLWCHRCGTYWHITEVTTSSHGPPHTTPDTRERIRELDPRLREWATHDGGPPPDVLSMYIACLDVVERRSSGDGEEKGGRE